MPIEYAEIILAFAAIVAAALFRRTRGRRVKHKEAGPPLRPSSPIPQSAATPPRPAGIASTWAPPSMQAQAQVAPTVIAPPGASPSWDQPASSPAKPGQQATWGSPAASPAPPGPPPAPSPAWAAGAPAAPAGAPPAPTLGAAPP